MAATYFVVTHDEDVRIRQDEQRFTQHADHVWQEFLDRIKHFRMLSQSLDDLWLKGSEPAAADWRSIVETLGGSGSYPGLESAGVLAPGPGGAYIAAWKALDEEALPQPVGPRLNGWRRAAAGAAESDQSVAPDASLDANAASTGRVSVISPICQKAPSGTHSRVVAWSALTLNVSGMLRGLVRPLPGEQHPRLLLEVHEISPAGERFIFSNRSEAELVAAEPRFHQARTFETARRRWRVYMASTRTFDAAAATPSPSEILVAGLLFSVLLTAMVYALTSARTRAVEIARKMTESFEQSAAEAKNLLAVADRSDTGLIILDRHMRLVWVNRMILERTGYSLDEVRSAHFGFLLHDPLLTGALEPGRPVVTEGDLRNRTGERSRMEFDLRSVAHGKSNPEYYLVTARPVDETSEYRRGLQRAQKALEAVGDRIAIWDPAGQLIHLNPSFEAGFGYSFAECSAIGGPFALVVDSALRDNLIGQPSLYYNQPVEVRMRCRTGSEHDMRVRIDRITDDLGLSLGTVAVFVDISEHKHLQVELSQARDSALENIRLKSAFLANMSHEIRTPLNGVTGMMNLLLTTRLDPEQREYAELANVSANSLLSVVNDILDFSKIEAGKLSLEIVPFDPRELLADAAAVMVLPARTKGLTLESSIGAGLPPVVLGDPARLRQVVFNLVGNAIKFTAKGSVMLQASARGERMRVEVTDTGIGIEPEARAGLFQPFVQADPSTTRKYGGTGLGLAISRQIVELMGGSIGLESQPGEGSTFWFEVPIEAVDAMPPQHTEQTTHA
ncbi:MAG: ATP-binding protein [Bryobacteraceae bacterium]